MSPSSLGHSFIFRLPQSKGIPEGLCDAKMRVVGFVNFVFNIDVLVFMAFHLTLMFSIFLIFIIFQTKLILYAYVLLITAYLCNYIKKSDGLPPGPPPVPLFGNTLLIDMKEPEKNFARYRSIYGRVFTLWLPNPTVILASHETLMEALSANGSATAGRVHNMSFTLFTDDKVNGDGVILSDGEKWSTLKTFIVDYFRDIGLNSNRLDSLILYNTAQLENEFKKMADGNLVNVVKPMSACIANIIQEVTIGRTYAFNDPEFTKQKTNIHNVVKEVMSVQLFLINQFNFLRHLPFFDRWIKYKNSGFALQRWFKKHFAYHKETRVEGSTRDFLDRFIEKMETVGKDEKNFKELTAVLTCGDIWTGGMETTVTTLSWGFIHLLRRPEIQEICHQEIVKVFGNGEPNYSRLNELPYIRAVIDEIQRVTNVLPWAIPHRTLETFTLQGFTIPANTELIPGIGAVLNDPTHFPDADEFRPERFLDRNGNYQRNEALRPFGIGPRSCLGERIARKELFLILCSILQNFKFYLENGDKLPTTDRVIGGITAPPRSFKTRVQFRNIRPLRHEDAPEHN